MKWGIKRSTRLVPSARPQAKYFPRLNFVDYEDRTLESVHERRERQTSAHNFLLLQLKCNWGVYHISPQTRKYSNEVFHRMKRQTCSNAISLFKMKTMTKRAKTKSTTSRTYKRRV